MKRSGHSGRQSRARFVVGAAGGLVASAAFRTPARAAQFEWKFAHAAPLTNPNHTRMVAMADAVRRESGGLLNIQVYGNSALGSDTATLTQVRAGAIQMVMMLGGAYGTLAPVAAIDELGFTFRNVRDARAALDGPLGAYIAKELSAHGLLMFRGTSDHGGFRQICSVTHPILRVEDFANFKIRTPPAKIAVDLFRAFGASPSPLNIGEVYSALQTHVVDGVELPLVMIDTGKYYEVVKYLSLTNHQYTALYICGNPDAYKSLPPDVQGILDRNMLKYSDLARRDAEALGNVLRQKLASKGLTVNELDIMPFRARLGSYYAYWKDQFGPTAWKMLEAAAGKLA